METTKDNDFNKGVAEVNDLRKRIIIAMSKNPSENIQSELERSLDFAFERLKIELGSTDSKITPYLILDTTLDYYIKLGANKEDVSRYKAILQAAAGPLRILLPPGLGGNITYSYMHYIMLDDLYAALRISKGSRLDSSDAMKAYR